MISPLEILRITASVLKNGFLIVQPESLTAGGDLGYVPQRSLFGFRSQLRDPDGSNAVEGLIAWEGDRGHALVLDDARFNHTLPDEGKGGSLQYAVFGAVSAPALSYVVCRGNDGSITTKTGKGAGPIRWEREAAGSPVMEMNDAFVELGATGGDFVIIDKGGAMTSWIQAVSAATGVPAPPFITATLVKAK